jgi:hypothetical protein
VTLRAYAIACVIVFVLLTLAGIWYASGDMRGRD